MVEYQGDRGLYPVWNILFCLPILTPSYQIQEHGHWPYASMFDALVTPLASPLQLPFHCSSIKSEKDP